MNIATDTPEYTSMRESDVMALRTRVRELERNQQEAEVSKRISDEERIINYFHSADLVGANVLYRVVTAAMKERNAAAADQGAPRPIRRRPRTSRKALGSSPLAPVTEAKEA